MAQNAYFLMKYDDFDHPAARAKRGRVARRLVRATAHREGEARLRARRCAARWLGSQIWFPLDNCWIRVLARGMRSGNWGPVFRCGFHFLAASEIVGSKIRGRGPKVAPFNGRAAGAKRGRAARRHVRATAHREGEARLRARRCSSMVRFPNLVFAQQLPDSLAAWLAGSSGRRQLAGEWWSADPVSPAHTAISSIS